jgi:hypothetical protein
MSTFPCSPDRHGHPIKLLFMQPGGAITVAGESPTLSEIEQAIGQTDVDRMVVIEEITNGQLNVADTQEESGADTSDGGVNVIGVNRAVTGKIKNINETVRKHLAEWNCHSRLRMWVITSKGWIFGGKTGYKVSNFIGPMLLPGFGVSSEYPLNFVWPHDILATDPAGQDDGFLELVNNQTT